jgi:hypothetical protein
MLFPTSPFIPAARQHTTPSSEVVIPAPAREPHDCFSMYRILPPGMPDYLEVSIIRFDEGTERCTAAVYGARSYVIHYEFKPH